mmetsp:Transcript_26579/g.57671  ORF Transcript_26579/g.57671 Transcript_26579/m.57671 type:complete len:515 (+) Transcript_26579:112-1656(+)
MVVDRSRSGSTRRGGRVRHVISPVFFILFGVLLGRYLLSFDVLGHGMIGNAPATTSIGAGSSSDNAATLPDANRSTTRATGATSSVASMLNHFPNQAIESEVHQHDRWIVDSLSYLHGFAKSDVERYASASAAMNANQNQTESSQASVTIIIFTVDRSVPYLTVGLSVLIRGHDPRTFANSLDVHVINVERRLSLSDESRKNNRRYVLFDELREKLSAFITFHDWSDPYPEHSHLVDKKQRFLAGQKRDFIRALEGLCKERENTKWCIMLEDDAVPVVDFATKFNKYVGNPEIYINANGPDGLGKVAVVKLFVPFNDGHNKQNGGRDLVGEDYARERYDIDRGVDVLEAEARGMHNNPIRYKIQSSSVSYGAVAEAYPRHIFDELSLYLRRMDQDSVPPAASTSNGLFFGGVGGKKINVAVKKKQRKIIPLDLSVGYHFILKTNLKYKVLACSPSLVKHIGHVSSFSALVNPDSELSRGGYMNYNRLSTDVRFALDDGSKAALLPRANDLDLPA